MNFNRAGFPSRSEPGKVGVDRVRFRMFPKIRLLQNLPADAAQGNSLQLPVGAPFVVDGAEFLKRTRQEPHVS